MTLGAWAERHRMMGHHPYPARTKENPERWNCYCGYIWRILTIEQIRQKFAHLGLAARCHTRSGVPPSSSSTGPMTALPSA